MVTEIGGFANPWGHSRGRQFVGIGAFINVSAEGIGWLILLLLAAAHAGFRLTFTYY